MCVDGADAATFLHGQFISDVAAMTTGDATLSAWCDAKGRTLAVFILARLEQAFWLLLPSALAESFIKRLGMYVLRAQVRIRYTPGTPACCAFIDAPPQALAQVLSEPEDGAQGLARRRGDNILITCPGTVTTVLTEGGQVKTRRRGEAGFASCDESAWEQALLEAGIAWLHPQTSGRFLPQELNLDRLNALSYDKGCYPGQEIIARVHYRGKVKRRLAHLCTEDDIPLEPGARLQPATPPHKAGIVLNGITTDQGQQALILPESLPEHAA